MLALQGFSLITVAALFGGLLVHAFKQFQTAHRSAASSGSPKLTLKMYFFDHWTESVTSLVCGLVLWAGLPEVARMFPEAATSLGLDGSVGVIGSFVCGYIGNSLADFIGGRAKAVVGG